VREGHCVTISNAEAARRYASMGWLSFPTHRIYANGPVCLSIQPVRERRE